MEYSRREKISFEISQDGTSIWRSMVRRQYPSRRKLTGYGMRKALKVSMLLSVLLSCVGCDQATKSAARKLLIASDPISHLHGFIRFEYVENPGAFLGIGAHLPGVLRFLLFVVLTSTMLTVMLLLATRERTGARPQLIGLALLVGGGIGNLIDRITNEGRVVDFVSVGLGPVRTGIFNVADVAVMTGAMLLIYGLLRNQEKSLLGQ
jgi:signal peptidase II